MNPREGCHGKIDVQGHAVKTDSFSDSQANTAKFSVADPHTAVTGIAICLDTDGSGNADQGQRRSVENNQP